MFGEGTDPENNRKTYFLANQRRTHEKKHNSWGSEKGLRMENCTKQSLRMAPNSKVEDT